MTADDHPHAGIPDADGLPTLVSEATQGAHSLQRLAESARAFVNEAAGRVAEFERRAAEAEQTIAQYEQRKHLLARALEDAQRTTDELMAAAHARAGETIAAAQATAETIVESARATAADTLQQARDAAEEERRTAKRGAAEELARLRDESTRIAEETSRSVREAREAAERYVSHITARLDAFLRDREDVSRGLEALARNHAESLEMMTRLRSEVQGEILPAVHRMLRTLKGKEGTSDDDAAAGTSAAAAPGSPPVEPEAPWVPPPAPVMPAPAHDEMAHIATGHVETAYGATGHDGAVNESPAAARHNGQVVVSPIYSFLQATRFMTALSKTTGVASVKLRTYSGAKATIEIVTEGRTLAGIDFQAVAGFPIEVVESSNVHVVLRIGNMPARSVPG